MASAALPEAVVSKKNVNVKYAFTCAIFASMASIILGYDIGVMSGASLYIKKDLKITDVQLEILVGIMNLYSLIGAFAAGRTSDWIGRRFTVVFAAAIFFAGALLMGFAVSYGMLMAGRFVAGVGVGYAIMIAPVYTAEISPAASRGLLTSFPDFFINLGILLGYVSNYAFARLPLYLSWRVMLGIGAAPSVLLALMVFVMPESPRWLVKKGRLADARAVLEKTSDTPEEAAERLADIKAAAGIPKDLDGDVVTVPKERHGETQVWKELVLSPTPAMRRILLSALGIHFFQQASGSDCVVLYSPQVFKSAGITGDNQLLGTTCAVGVSKTLFILVATFLLDRVGRRPLLLCSAGGMMVSLVGLGTGLTVVGHHPDEKIPWAVALCIASTLAYVAFFSVGLGYRRRRDPRRGDRRRSNAGVLATTPAPLVLPVPATANSPSALLYPSPSPSTAPSICWSPPQLSSPSPPPNSSPSPSISPTTENSSSPAFFNVDECFKPWVLRSASKKWKDFKAVLKRTYFDPNLTRRQNIHNGCGRRIPDSQWEWLVKYWKTSKSQDKCEKNKAIRAAQLNGTHTTGSRSFAVTLDQMEIKEGRQVARAELYIVTHTKRNGEPVDKYSGDNINQIRKQFAANPSLVGEEARDGDVFSGLFPKERNGRWRGLGLLVGGTASKELAEVKAELHETKTENLRLWSVIQALQKNQSALQEQHNDLKDMLLSSQRQHGHGDRDQKILPESKDPLEDIEADNQDREVSISYKGSKRSKLKTKENETISSQHISKKRQPTRQLEKTPPSLQLKGQTIISDKNQHKKTRRFQTPLQKGGLAVLKRGLEVGLISPQSTSMVAFATVQAADRRSKCTDGRPLEDCVEVLINTVFSKTTLLPRSHGNISKLASAVGKCIPWPRKNIEPLDDGSGDLPTTKASSVTASDNGAPKEHSVKRKKVNSISLSGQPVSTTCT